MKKILLSAIFIATALTSFSQVGIGTNSPNASAALDVESTTLGFLPPRMTSAEMTAIAAPAEGLTVYCNDCTPKSLYFFNGTDYIAAVDGTVVSIPAAIGDFRDGGVVFWVDPADNTHGLVCAIEDQSAGIRWYNGVTALTSATGSAIGTGTTNTDAIIAVQGVVETDYAAGLARAYNGGGFNDWFLPSNDELNEMYLNKATIEAAATANGGANFSITYYWTSTEVTLTQANHYNLLNAGQGFNNKGVVHNVRAVRAF